MGSDSLQPLRLQAWQEGRALCDHLLEQYRQAYHREVAPPPAVIGAELFTDFLQVEVREDPLPLDRFAQTEWIEDHLLITVNAQTGDIPGVKDIQGVKNVAMWHEGSHATRDIDHLRRSAQAAFPGFGGGSRIICHRWWQKRHSPGDEAWLREFWAEEAGRAAAVSHAALARSEAFVFLVRRGGGASLSNGEAWRLLYQSAADIGVNCSALVAQLSLEGLIVVTKEGPRQLLHIQPSLPSLMGAV
jgi:hypothetical protein